LEDQIKWTTTNNHCDGGMPFAAFNYAIKSRVGIVSAAELPYKDGSSSSSSSTCPISSNSVGAAFITGWEQVKATSCSAGGAGMKEALKAALQQGPISTAIATNSAFDMYKGGLYTCSNNGDIQSQNEINHAITLVGYTDDYWIIKNSYGSGWGDSGYLHLAMDDKLNCGLSVFPVMVQGAQQGDRSQLPDDISDEYDDEDKFLGMSKKFWIWIGVGAGGVFILAIIAGIIQKKRQERLQRQYTQQLHQPFQVNPTYNQGYNNGY
jgi:cathepsin L